MANDIYSDQMEEFDKAMEEHISSSEDEKMIKLPSSTFSIFLDEFKKKRGKHSALDVIFAKEKWDKMTHAEIKSYSIKYSKLVREFENQPAFKYDDDELVDEANMRELYKRWRIYYGVKRSSRDIPIHFKAFKRPYL